MVAHRTPILYRNSYKDANCGGELQARLVPLLIGRITILCIGTQRSAGDCLGPLVGTRLKYLNIPGANILGTLAEPVHAQNLGQIAAELNCSRAADTIVAVDACLGNRGQIGWITLRGGPLSPGAGVHKSLPVVGDVSLTGIVNGAGSDQRDCLRNTDIRLVSGLADVITEALAGALRHVRAGVQCAQCSTWNIPLANVGQKGNGRACQSCDGW